VSVTGVASSCASQHIVSAAEKAAAAAAAGATGVLDKSGKQLCQSADYLKTTHRTYDAAASAGATGSVTGVASSCANQQTTLNWWCGQTTTSQPTSSHCQPS
jgi:hypothetical protein